MIPTFLHQTRPLIIGMVNEKSIDAARWRIKNSIYAGADGVGIELEKIPLSQRTADNLKKLFAAAGGHPVYITNYRGTENEGLSDEDLMAHEILALKCGATMADIMGDTFDPCDLQLTNNEKAVKKQKAFIMEVHAMGKEVLMSSHIYRNLPAETVLSIAKAQQSRGADIVKIVTMGNSDKEEMENLRITMLLKHELKTEFLFLSNGTHNKIHRMIGPMLGCFGYLAVVQHDGTAVPTQPTIAAAKNVRDSFDYLPDVPYTID